MFGEKLKELRIASGLSQKALAEKSGLTQKAISFWEAGLRQPTWAGVQALCEAMGLDCNAFAEKPAAKKGKKI